MSDTTDTTTAASPPATPTKGAAATAPAVVETAAPAAEPDEFGERFDALSVQWISGHIANGPIARNPECFAQLQNALGALKELLRGD